MGLLALMLLVLARAGPGYAQVSADAWMENYTLILTEAQNITEAYQAQNAVERAGGQVYIIIPNRVMLGKVPTEAEKGLVGKAKIRGVYHKPVEGTALSSLELDMAATNGIAFFNEVASGAWKARKDKARAMMAGRPAPKMMRDVDDPQPFSYSDYLANLKAKGITEEMLKTHGISLEQRESDIMHPSQGGNSEYLAGKVLFNTILLESNGAIDPNQYSWTYQDRVIVYGEIAASLSWWASTAQSAAYKTPLTFVTLNHSGVTSYEPIRYAHWQDYLWISEIMGKWGYTSGDYNARCTAFNTAMRIKFNTNWSVASFVAYNPAPAPTTFTDGWHAYVGGGGYSQLLLRNNGWPTTDYDRVNAHELGHLFGAPDEYNDGSGCTSSTVVIAHNGVYNGNCVKANPNAIPCVMNANSLALCGYTPGHVGWNSLINLTAGTFTKTGVPAEFFHAGQPILYRAYLCLKGPRVGTTSHDVKCRFRANFFTGDMEIPGTSTNDSQWITLSGPIAPPTSTGQSCYWLNWETRVPIGINSPTFYGPATLTVQVAVEKYGKGAASDTARFYVSKYANDTPASPALSSADNQEAQESKFYISPAPPP
jgi:hypothetical protein